MTHSFHSNRRKRENECDDFNQPVSAKRLKTKNVRDNEHINSTDSNFSFGSVVKSSSASASDKDQMSQYSHNVIAHGFQNHVTHCEVQTEIAVVSSEYVDQINLKYLPDLSAIENPHYYENNKLLFELYVERTQRSACHPVSTSHQF